MADSDEMVKALRGMGTPQPETYEPVVQGIANAVAVPGQLANTQNPYPQGSEEAQFFENSRHAAGQDWANRTAMSLMGTGMPMAEQGAAGIFGGKLAKTADLDKLAFAAKNTEKLNPSQIWKETGWFRPPTDNKWRFEIPDTNARMLGHGMNYADEGASTTGPASMMLQHKELYQAYPQLGDKMLQNSVLHNPKNGMGTGQYGQSLIAVNSPDLLRATNVGLHEMQHGVQEVEHFAPGGNPSYMAHLQESKPSKMPLFEQKSDPVDIYHRLAGEVEARNVQYRHLNDQLNRKTEAARGLSGAPEIPNWHPAVTQDTPYQAQLVHDPSKDIIRALRLLK